MGESFGGAVRPDPKEFVVRRQESGLQASVRSLLELFLPDPPYEAAERLVLSARAKPPTQHLELRS